MGITASGIGSNLDVNSIVSQLVALDRRPLTVLDRKEAAFQGRLSSLGTLKGALSSLLASGQSLAGLNTSAFRASSSDPAAFTATASSSASAGVHTVEVTLLAQAQRLAAAGRASSTAAIGSGADTTLTFNFGGITGTLDPDTGLYSGATFTPDTEHASFTVALGSGDNTLEGIRDAINAADAGVTAAIVNDGNGSPYRLTLSVGDTGAKNSLKIDVSGDAELAALLAYDPEGTQRLSQTQEARNASLTVDGLAVSSATNSVTGAIDGVTIALLNPTAAPATLTVARDIGSAAGVVALFVKAYNEFNSAFRTATGKGAALQGHAGVLGIQQRLRAALGATYGSGAHTTLSSIGVAMQLDGSLKFDAAKLEAALSANAAGARAAIAGAGAALQAVAEGALGSQGIIEANTSGIDRSIRDIGNRRTAIEQQLVSREKRYRAQFSALDAMLGRMNQTSSYLQQQLANVPSANGK